MKTFLFVLLVALSVSNVYGHCKYDGGVKGVGETIYIKDPYLVKETTDILHADGYTPEQIDNYLKNADWVGYVLKCTKIYHVNTTEKNFERPAAMLVPFEYRFVPVDHQIEWIEHLTRY